MFEELKKDKDKAFVIAEIGSNHCGLVDRAIELIKSAKYCGADAVKFQKRSNKSLFTKELYDSPYDNKNSYGKTYGEHREYLEFGKEEYCVLQDLCKEIDINFFATPFDFESVDFLSEFDLPAYKIASADIINPMLVEYVAKLGKPIVLSTGGGTMTDIRRMVDTILPINDQLVILHCTASYPVLYHDMNLNVIPKLIKEFPNQIIGLSDHENGAHAASLAYYLGARVFEKHFTSNRAWKGTDHSFSLESRGFTKLIRNLSRIPGLLGDGEKKLLSCEEKPLYKMRKSIVANKNLKEGTTLDLEHFDYRCAGDGGLESHKLYQISGSQLNVDVVKGEKFTLQNTTNHIGINKYGKYTVAGENTIQEFFHIREHNIHEHKTIECVLKNVNDKSIITAGTHCGFFLPAFSKSTIGKVYGFEPIKENYDISVKNVELNKLKNVKLFNIGLHSKKVLKNFIVLPGGDGGSKIKRDEIDVRIEREIKCVDLDSVIPKDEKISIIQLDVEFNELNVLKGAKRIIKENLSLLILEAKGFNYRRDALSKQFFEEFLEPLGYKKINMVHNNYVFRV